METKHGNKLHSAKNHVKTYKEYLVHTYNLFKMNKFILICVGHTDSDYKKNFYFETQKIRFTKIST